MKYQYLGIIPARGGSKRLVRKNVLPVFGKSLFCYSIDAGMLSKKIDKLVVSTDDKSIKTISDMNGVTVVKRPSELAGDDVPLTPVIKHVLDNIDAENVVILRPTSPIRVNSIIDKAIEEFEKSGADSLMTGFINKEYEWFTLPDTPSQRLKGWFQGDGCVEIHKSSVIKAGNSYGEKCNRFEIPEIYNHEIDTELDLEIVKHLMKYVGMVHDNERD